MNEIKIGDIVRRRNGKKKSIGLVTDIVNNTSVTIDFNIVNNKNTNDYNFILNNSYFECTIDYALGNFKVVERIRE